MKKDISEFDKLPVLFTECVSIDKLVMLVRSPGFSVYEIEKRFEDTKLMPDELQSKLYRAETLINKTIEGLVSLFDDDDIVRFKGETQLYVHHYNIKNIDLQLCAKNSIGQKIKDEEYISIHGSEEEQEQGFMWEYEPTKYNIRIEYNPNKSSIKDVSSILSFLKNHFYFDDIKDQFIKFTRIDVALDYPEPIDPCLINFKRSRKGQNNFGSRGIETVYFGSRGSDVQLTIYDKKKEYFEKQEIIYQGAYLWRLEMRSKNTFYLGQMPGLCSYFERIEVFCDGLVSLDWKEQLIKREAMHWGINSVLKVIPKRTRCRYIKSWKKGLEGKGIRDPQELYLINIFKLWEEEQINICDSFGLDFDDYKINKKMVKSWDY